MTTSYKLKKILFISLIIFCSPVPQPLFAVQLEFLSIPELVVRFEPPLKGMAEDVVHIYPPIKSNLEKTFGWKMPFRPTVFLIQHKEYFQRLSGNKLIVAFAAPAENLMVIDCSRLHIRPHRLDQILKHEMVHLILHRHIRSAHLPRWLDEGVAQWLSEGVAELLEAPQRYIFEEALLSGNHIPLRDLNHRFPADKKNLMLAYAESRSVVDFISDRYGDHSIFEILHHLQKGNEIHTAFAETLNTSPEEIEDQWIRRQHRPTTWFIFLTGHIYEFLFLSGALLTVIGFIRFLIKKHQYRDEDED
ncbi:MAG: peptidase MA family metallohydrolase [Thermodesulfobacteriota bacterium]|nr:peptidase MA family metallohydrolase [Thermodesulfobacteriota bacterium]